MNLPRIRQEEAIRHYLRNVASMLVDAAASGDARVLRLALQVLLFGVPRTVRALIAGASCVQCG